MGSVSDEELAIARVYSHAMLTLAEKTGRTDALLEELTELVNYQDEHPEFEDFLTSPMVDVEARQATIEKVFRGRAGDLLVDSLQVLNRKDRLGLLPGIAETYRLARQEMRGFVDVHVLTAVRLSDAAREKLREVAAEHTGKRARLVETVDETVIGGMVLRIGDEKFDTSVSTRLRKLGSSLMERASHELHSGRAYVVGTAEG